MAIYQCPDCLGVHAESTEAVVGIFVRCDGCRLDAEIRAEAQGLLEFVPAEAA